MIYFLFIEIITFRFVWGFGDWGLGIGDWGLGPIPNPQSPIPKSPYEKIKKLLI
jgi:hypothetical protein